MISVEKMFDEFFKQTINPTELLAELLLENKHKHFTFNELKDLIPAPPKKLLRDLRDLETRSVIKRTEELGQNVWYWP